PDTGEDALAEFAVAAQSIAAEARALAHPVSFEVVSSSKAEGIEDRMTMAPLSARRLADMADLAARGVALALFVAAQAIDLPRFLPPALAARARPSAPRGFPPRGEGPGGPLRLRRELAPSPGHGQAPPADLEP